MIEQRYNESSEDYEKRKKRVSLQMMGGATLVHRIPKILESIVSDGFEDGIMIEWDTPMQYSANIQDAINVIVNGAAPIHPDHITSDPSNPKVIALQFPTKFKFGDVITWAYDDQNPTEELRGNTGVEAENQTYAVTNDISSTSNTIGFVSAEATDAHTVIVTLDDDKATGATKDDWMVKIEENPATNNTVTLSGNKMTVVVVETMTSANTNIKVEHLVAGDGIKQVLDFVVTNNIV